MNRVELLFKEKATLRSNIHLYTKNIAIDFVNECRKFNIPILGIDALIIKGQYIEPSMANSIDFTSAMYLQSKPENVWDASISFLLQRDELYHFEIVC